MDQKSDNATPSFDEFMASRNSSYKPAAQPEAVPSFGDFKASRAKALSDNKPSDPFVSTLKSTGANILNSVAGQPIEDIGGAVGSQGLQEFGRGVRQYAEGVQKDNPSQINSLSDIAAHPIDAAKTALGNMIPQIPVSMAGAYAGAELGALTSPVTGPVGPLVGGLAGMFLPSYAQEYTEMRSKQHEIGQENIPKALAYAAPAAASDVVLDKVLMGGSKLLPGPLRNAVADTLAPGASRAAHIAKQAAKGFGAEAAQEYGQTYLEQLGGNQDTSTEQATDERNVSAALGGFGGGVLKGGLSVFDQRATDPNAGPLSRAASKAPLLQQPETTITPLPVSKTTADVTGVGDTYNEEEGNVADYTTAFKNKTDTKEPNEATDTKNVSVIQTKSKSASGQPDSVDNSQGGVDERGGSGFSENGTNVTGEAQYGADSGQFDMDQKLAGSGADNATDNQQPPAASQALSPERQAQQNQTSPEADQPQPRTNNGREETNANENADAETGQERLLNQNAPEQSGAVLPQQNEAQRNTDNGLPEQTIPVADSRGVTERADSIDLQDRGVVDAAPPTETIAPTQSTAPGAGADTARIVASDAETKAKPVETFTHELSDGTLATQIGENTYKDAKGEEVQDDYATPINGAITNAKQTEQAATEREQSQVEPQGAQAPGLKDSAVDAVSENRAAESIPAIKNGNEIQSGTAQQVRGKSTLDTGSANVNLSNSTPLEQERAKTGVTLNNSVHGKLVKKRFTDTEIKVIKDKINSGTMPSTGSGANGWVKAMFDKPGTNRAAGIKFNEAFTSENTQPQNPIASETAVQPKTESKIDEQAPETRPSLVDKPADKSRDDAKADSDTQRPAVSEAGEEEEVSADTKPSPESQLDTTKVKLADKGEGGVKYSKSAPETLADVKVKIDSLGAKNYISEKNGLITVSNITVPKESRNKGIGTQAMKLITDYADRTNQRVALTPSSDFGGNKARLVEFYKRLGFVANTGRNKDYTISETMFRELVQGKFSKSTPVTGSTVADIRAMLPARVNKLAAAGKLVVVQSADELPSRLKVDGVQALYDNANGNDTIYLVADALNNDNILPVTFHELIHRGEAQDPKLKAAIDRFESDLSRRFDLAARGIGTKVELNAYQRVIAAETPKANQLEEHRAYLISEYMRSPDSFTGKVKQVFADFIAAIRAFLIRNGADLGFIKSLTSADLAALSKYGAAVHRQGVDNKILSQLASVYKWEGTAQEYDQQFYDGVFSEDGKKPGVRLENKTTDDKAKPPVSKAKPAEASGVRYSKSMDSAIVTEAKRKAGLGPKKTLSQAITDILQRGISANLKALQQRWEELKPQLEQGIFDKFYGIKLAEQEILGDVAHSLSGYISARLSTGSSSTMQALLLHGAPKWSDGIIQKKDGSKGFAEMLQPVKDDLENFTAWMVGRRADRLYREGKENNFSRDEIDALLALKQGSYQEVADDIAAMNTAVLDLAQDAGLVDPESRKLFENADYIPFYRLVEGKKSGPSKKGGLSHQNSGIKMLKGGENPMSDPLGNMMQNWAHLIDASMKNDALNKTLVNLDGSRFITGIPRVEFKQALIPKEQVKKLMLESGLPKEIVDAMPADLTTGIAKMWQLQAPTDPDVVRVMRDGKSEYYKVNDAMLLTSLSAVNQIPFGGIFKPMRYMKQLLTGAITADPTFMARNFIRDSMHSWTIAEEKGFKLGLDSIHGAVKSFKEEGGYVDMMFAGASFQGGYGNYNNPDAARESMDAALRRKGIKDIQGFKDSILDTPKKYWEMYRSVGDAIENASREAILENSKQAGAEKAKYLFEAKDLMDFSMQGSFTLIRAMSDMLPFFNARLIGLYRLAKAGKTPEARKMILAKGLSITMFSLALLALNADNDDYEALEDFDKDQYFHFFFGDQHYRIPKPFELGLIFGTIPERSARALLGKDTLVKYAERMGHGVSDTLAFNPVPQVFKPFVEIYANKDMFTGRAIEGMADEGKLPSARYNEYTSETMRALSDSLPEWLGLSPKRLEHLMHGYLGALGMYALGASDMMVRQLSGMPELPDSRVDRLPVIKAFYQEKPTMHTKYGTEFHDMLNEVNQIYRTINAYKKEGNFEKAEALRLENADKLKARKPLESASKSLSKLRAQVDVIYRSKLSASDKRRKIDAIMQQSNDVSRAAVERTHPYFD